MRIQKAVLTGLMMGLIASPTLAADADIHIQNPWVRAAPPSVKILAAYMKIENSSDRLRTLTGATSPHFEQVEMHNTVIHKGLAKMVREEKLEIPPQGAIVFKPGGYHFMLIGPNKAITPGESIDFTLTFLNGGEISTKAEVLMGIKSDTDHSGHTKHQH